MKKTIIFALASTAFLFSSCKKDNNTPVDENETELITTVQLTFSPQNGGNDIVYKFVDKDGAGGNDPIITNDTLSANTTYNLSVSFLDETSNPPDTITNEVREENLDHQVFFQPDSNLNISFSYNDVDDHGHPLGLQDIAATGAASSGNLKITLRHQPDKSGINVPSGDITNAGGETDAEVTFDVVIQ